MNKKQVQQRVLQSGKKLALNKFTWDEKTKTLSSEESGLVLDFRGIDNCTFNTSSNCTFKTGYGCTFKTYSGCTFDTGSGCTFNTSSNCTFKTGPNCTFKTGYGCVIVRGGMFQVIQPEEGEAIKLCPNGVKGYISKRDGEDAFYLDTEDGRVEHVIADGILSRVVNKRNGVYKVVNHGEVEESYIIEVDGVFSHGSTLKEAKESLIYKLSDRDTSKYEGLALDAEMSFEEGVQMYMAITGACSSGTKYFVDTRLEVKKDKYTITEILKITEGQYNHAVIVEFFK